MESVYKLISNKCSKYIFEYLDMKLPYIEELINKTEILYEFTNDEIHYQSRRIVDWGDEIEILDPIWITRSDDKKYWTIKYY